MLDAHPPISHSLCCWHCRYGRFKKRDNRPGRGICLFITDLKMHDFPLNWWPPEVFWNQVRDGTFPINFKSYKSMAPLYYGLAFLLSPDQGRMAVDYERLSKLAGEIKGKRVVWISRHSVCQACETATSLINKNEDEEDEEDGTHDTDSTQGILTV